jgi:hypothetical protein
MSGHRDHPIKTVVLASVLGDLRNWVAGVFERIGDVSPYWLVVALALKTCESAFIGLTWRKSDARPAREEPQEAGARAGRALTQTAAACWSSRTRKASTMSLTPRMIANAATQAISSVALRP